MTNAQFISADYVINYNGTELKIQNNRKIMCLPTNGGGETGAAGYYYGFQYYDLFVATKADFGKTITKIGTAKTDYDGIAISCQYEIGGVSHLLQGFCVDEVFMKIFKK